MKEKNYFLDSYAVIEILKSNPNYGQFLDAPLVSTRINLVEVAYHLIESFPKQKAEEIIFSLKFSILEIEEKQITAIAHFRKENSKKKLSYIDCIGYVLAKEHGLKFVTGDKEFKGMQNVEFVK
ncbi:MAG: type II toxin-antitoxin system VapC family toxin [Candidatus Diapherotrites archaeon]|nr:type II toxin-antitoxin system VapC family toxin [Candidatus Diapherotrites archaeon]